MIYFHMLVVIIGVHHYTGHWCITCSAVAALLFLKAKTPRILT